MHSDNPAVFYTWLKVVTLGEFCGFVIPTIAGVVTAFTGTPPVIQMIVLVLAGMGEGFVLGFSQSYVLTKQLPKFNQRGWIVSTMIGAGVAWSIGMLPSTFSDVVIALPIWLLIPFSILFGSALLLSIGVAQYRYLKPYVNNASKWIWVNVLAWLVGLSVVMGFIFLAPDGLCPTIICSALGGFGMALTMAAITGRSVNRIATLQRL